MLRRRFVPFALLTLAALYLHAGRLAGGRPIWRDSVFMYVPAKRYLWELLHKGALPQWYPFDALGAPFLAQPMYSTIHPTTLLYAVLPFWSAFAAQDFAATWLALTGTYLLARALRLPRIPSLTAALLYGANGYVVALGEHQFMALAAGSMPWYAWALLRARCGGAWMVLPALAMGLLLLAGDPQVAILAAGTGALLLLAIHGISRRNVLLAILAPLAGALLAAVQLLPSLRLFPFTERAGAGFSVSTWSLGAEDLAAMAFPVRTRPDAWISTTVFGLVGFALVGAALARFRRRSVRALVVLAIVSVWLALGDAWGLNAVLRHVLPFWGKLRYPMKSVVVAYLALSLLAGIGFTALASRRERMRAVRLGLLAALVPLLAFLFVLREAPSLAPALSTVAGLVAVLVLPARRALRPAALVVIAATLLAFAEPVILLGDASAWAPSPLVNALRESGVGLYGPAFERWDDRPKGAFDWVEEALFAGGADWTGTGGYFGLPAVTIYQTGSSSRLHEVMPVADREANLGLSRLFGAGYFVVRSDEAPRDGRVLRTFPEFGLSLVQPLRSLPRAYAVHRARMVADASQAGTELRSPSFKPGREILVEGAEPHPDWAARPDTPSIPATILARSDTTVDLRVDAPWPGFVVLNEAWFPGWTAEVDGNPTPVLVANGAVRAVETPAGPHVVRFHYRTPGLVVGAWVSVASLLALVLAARLLRRHPS